MSTWPARTHRRALRRALFFAGAAVLVVAATATPRSQQPQAESSSFYPAYAPDPPAQRSGGNRSQPGETWDGAAPGNPRRDTAVSATREFAVLAGFENASLTVTISWDPGPLLGNELELRLDRRDGEGWIQIGRSTGVQLLDDGEAVATVTVDTPPAGAYRARTVNAGRRPLAYHGVIGFGVTEEPATPSDDRATADRPDSVAGPQLHVIYFVPSDAVDEGLDTKGVLQGSIAAINDWFTRQTPGRRLRVDSYTDGSGSDRLDVSYVAGQRSQAQYATGSGPFGVFVAITSELESRGWTANPAQKRYLVYYEGPADDLGVCGTAYVPRSANGYAGWSVLFLDATPGCGSRDFGTPATGGGLSEAVAVQELQHNEGMTPLEAGRHCSAIRFHICAATSGRIPSKQDAEALDVMFPWATAALRDKQLDPGRDDYFGHPFPYRDLADSPFWEAP